MRQGERDKLKWVTCWSIVLVIGLLVILVLLVQAIAYKDASLPEQDLDRSDNLREDVQRVIPYENGT